MKSLSEFLLKFLNLSQNLNGSKAWPGKILILNKYLYTGYNFLKEIKK